MPETILVIACGALAREITALKKRHGWQHVTLKCIDAKLHNRPALIPSRVRALIHRHAADYARVFVAYADCGTAGELDRVLDAEGVERLPGPHCYQCFAGSERFESLASADPGTFYLTDFLARHFERLVVEPLGLDRHPELRDAYFGNYSKLVYLSQTQDTDLLARARCAADRLALEFVHEHTGYGELETELGNRLSGWNDGEKNARLLA